MSLDSHRGRQGRHSPHLRKIWGPDGPTDLPEATWQVLNEHKGNLGLVAALKGTALGLLAMVLFLLSWSLSPAPQVPCPTPCPL